MSEEALKPCPFCGAKDFNRFVHSSFAADGPVSREKNQCLNCGAEAPLEQWNIRPYEAVWDDLESTVTTLRAQVAALRETLIRCDNLLMPYDAWDLKHTICNDIRIVLAATEGEG